jgi:hypothetical protein
MLFAVVSRPSTEADTLAEAEVGPGLGLFEAAKGVEEIHASGNSAPDRR